MVQYNDSCPNCCLHKHNQTCRRLWCYICGAQFGKDDQHHYYTQCPFGSMSARMQYLFNNQQQQPNKYQQASGNGKSNQNQSGGKSNNKSDNRQQHQHQQQPYNNNQIN